MFKFNLFGGNASKYSAAVTKNQQVCTIDASYPAFGQQKTLPFRQYLTDDGLSAGNNSMVVDGSVTPVDYYIEANKENDIYITVLNFIVAYGSSGSPYLWADGTALTNGSRLFYTSRNGEQDIHDSIKVNQDFFRVFFEFIPTSWEVRHINALNDFGYFITLDLQKFGFPYGIKLDAGSNQRLTMRINDNTTTDTDSFDCIAYGFERFE